MSGKKKRLKLLMQQLPVLGAYFYNGIGLPGCLIVRLAFYSDELKKENLRLDSFCALLKRQENAEI